MKIVVSIVGSLLGFLTLPLMILNFFGGIVSGIWLLVLHRWSDFGFGIGILFLGSFLISILLLPSIALTVPGIRLMETGQVMSGAIVGLLGSAWTYLVMIAWCVTVFTFLIRHADGHIWPYVLWAYANATGPWTYAASRENQNDDGPSMSFIATFFAQLACVAAGAAAAIWHVVPSFATFSEVIAPFMGIALVIQSVFFVGISLDRAAAMRSQGTAADFY